MFGKKSQLELRIEAIEERLRRHGITLYSVPHSQQLLERQTEEILLNQMIFLLADDLGYEWRRTSEWVKREDADAT